jgi:nicotinamidase-related amidase
MAGPILVVIGVQERLFNVMDTERRDDMVANIKILVTAARRLGVPMLVTEQYPKGLGRTLPELKTLLDGVTPIEKTAFSCCGADGFTDRLKASGADRVILVGIEAHVCVLLTALDLLRASVPVEIVADGVCSRRPANLTVGLEQARQAGAVLTSTETVVFQWLGRADSDAFRELSKLLR